MKIFLLLMGLVKALALQATETNTGGVGKVFEAAMLIPNDVIKSKISNLGSIKMEEEVLKARIQDNKKDLLTQPLLFVKAEKLSPKDKERFFKRLDVPITEFSTVTVDWIFYQTLVDKALPLASNDADKASMQIFVRNKADHMASLLSNLIDYAAYIEAVGGYESGSVEAYDLWLSKR